VTAAEKLILFLAQGLGTGRIGFAPGTFGSLLGLLIAAGLLLLPPGVFFVCCVAMILPGVWLCGRAEALLQTKDPASIVLDEIVAVPWCFLLPKLGAYRWGDSDALAPDAEKATAAILLGGFALFRLFDIWKPWPVRQAQRLQGGWGVVADDLLAATYVNLVFGIGWPGWSALLR
jgi:phosphatidylglycerophosphatase A